MHPQGTLFSQSAGSCLGRGDKTRDVCDGWRHEGVEHGVVRRGHQQGLDCVRQVSWTMGEDQIRHDDRRRLMAERDVGHRCYDMRYAEKVAHFQDVWDAIDNVNSARAKHLFNSPMFWTEAWHTKWRTAAWDRLYDYVDSKTTGQANMEVVDVGMSKSPTLRKHLTRQFGGSGEDVRAREARYQDGMPRAAGEKPFHKGVVVPNNVSTKARGLTKEKDKERKNEV